VCQQRRIIARERCKSPRLCRREDPYPRRVVQGCQRVQDLFRSVVGIRAKTVPERNSHPSCMWTNSMN
jgi:hypothetical protein